MVLCDILIRYVLTCAIKYFISYLYKIGRRCNLKKKIKLRNILSNDNKYFLSLDLWKQYCWVESMLFDLLICGILNYLNSWNKTQIMLIRYNVDCLPNIKNECWQCAYFISRQLIKKVLLLFLHDSTYVYADNVKWTRNFLVICILD